MRPSKEIEIEAELTACIDSQNNDYAPVTITFQYSDWNLPSSDIAETAAEHWNSFHRKLKRFVHSTDMNWEINGHRVICNQHRLRGAARLHIYAVIYNFPMMLSQHKLQELWGKGNVKLNRITLNSDSIAKVAGYFAVEHISMTRKTRLSNR